MFVFEGKFNSVEEYWDTWNPIPSTIELVKKPVTCLLFVEGNKLSPFSSTKPNSTRGLGNKSNTTNFLNHIHAHIELPTLLKVEYKSDKSAQVYFINTYYSNTWLDLSKCTEQQGERFDVNTFKYRWHFLMKF